MLVDNPVQMPPSTSTPSLNDLEEFLNTELFGSASTSATASMSPGPSGSNSSRASSPSSSAQSDILSTPPQPLENTFPDPYSYLGGVGAGDFGFFAGGANLPSTSSFFNFLDEEMKVDPSSSSATLSFDSSGTPFDFMSALGLGAESAAINNATNMAIDPQLVDSPKEGPSGDGADDTNEPSTDSLPPAKHTRSASASSSSPPASSPVDGKEKLTLTIAPVKVGGHGKAGRKGTIQSGGIVKKVASPPSTVTSSLALPLPTTAAAAPLTNTYLPSTSFPSTLSNVSATTNKENSPMLSTKSSSFKGDDEKQEKDDDDDLPADWRPPPEVFAKMSSKEKRQLRNKISARNFRVRRKEYISTLEMDIAERDRLLQSIRTELGSTQSENFALRQEVAALKKALLEGRGAGSLASASTSPTTSTLGIGRAGSPALSIRGSDVNLNTAAALSLDDLNLPPPAPLPERSAAEELALRAAAAANASAAASTSASNNTLLVPNTQKDLPTSPRLSALGGVGFWGGVSQAGFGAMGMGGGYTPVHTALMPDLQLGGPAGTGNGMPNPSIGQWVRDVLAANAAVANLGHSDEDSSLSSSREESPRPLQENMNPVMQQAQEENATQQQQGTAMNWNASLNSNSPHAGFDGFVDMNPFTMKTLDAYRMQLWTRMASSSHPAPHPNQQQHSPPAQSPSASSSHSPSSIHSSSSYAAQRKALERELASSSPFTLPGPHHQSPPSNNNSHSPPYLNGLASSLKPAYFVNSNKPNLPSSNSSARSGMGSTLSALLAGKHSTPSAFGSLGSASSSAAAWSPPGSPNLNLSKKPSFNASSAKSTSSSSTTAPQPQPTPAQIQQVQNAMYAAALASTASTTLLGRLGGAFWDAFSGSGHPAGGSSASPSSTQSHAPTVPSGSGASSGGIFGAGLGQGRTNRPWDVDKVRKVLEGKAVVRVVDVDELPSGSGSSASHSMGVSTSPLGSKPVPAVSASSKDDCGVAALLEEGMKSLSLGKK